MGDRLGIRGVLHSFSDSILAIAFIFKGNNLYMNVSSQSKVFDRRLNDQATLLEITL